jgi:hypothetical protein
MTHLLSSQRNGRKTLEQISTTYHRTLALKVT